MAFSAGCELTLNTAWWYHDTRMRRTNAAFAIQSTWTRLEQQPAKQLTANVAAASR